VTAAHAEALLARQETATRPTRRRPRDDILRCSSGAGLRNRDSARTRENYTGVDGPFPKRRHRNVAPLDRPQHSGRRHFSPFSTGRSVRTAQSRVYSKLADIAYVGAGVLGSACGMDKHIMKELFRSADLPLVKHVTILRSDWEASPAKGQRFDRKQTQVPSLREARQSGSRSAFQSSQPRRIGSRMKEAAATTVSSSSNRRRRKNARPRNRVLRPRQRQAAASIAGEIVPPRNSTTMTPSI